MSIQKNIEGIFKNWKQSLTSEEKNILCEYSKFLYEDVNLFLRDDILNRFILDEEILVYRNEHHSISLEEMHEFLCGVDRIEYRNFVSTSFTKEASEQFLSILKNQYQNDIFLCIEGNINKGVPCGYLDKDISVMLGEEDEILMSRNIIFKIKQNSIIINNIDKTINIYGEFTKE